MKEKLLAALRGGIQTVLIPQDNVKDLADIPLNVRELLNIQAVQNIDQVLALALERQPGAQAIAATAKKIEASKKASAVARKSKTSATISPRSAPRKTVAKRKTAPIVLPLVMNEKTKKIRSEKTKH